MNEKIASMSAQEVSDAQTAHFRVDDDISRAMRSATLDQKRVILDKVIEILGK